MDNNRLAAYYTLYNIEHDDAYSNLAINKELKCHNVTNSAFVKELVYGVLERKYTLDYYISQLIDRPIKKKKAALMTLLRMGIYQMKYMDKVPGYSACNETVQIANKVAGSFYKKFVNGVLREFSRKIDAMKLPEGNSVEALSIRFSYEPWIIRLWIEQFGLEAAIDIIKASNERAELSFRANTLKTTREALVYNLTKAGYDINVSDLSSRAFHGNGELLKTDFFKEGYFSVQDEASIIAVEGLNPKADDKLLDMCAAPGGKSFAAAEIMDNKGSITASDIYPHKLQLIENGAKRLGVSIITPKLQNGLELVEEYIEKFDKIIVDGPCSGLGVIRRRPEIKYKSIQDNGKELSEIQGRLLDNAAAYVVPGGEILYSTCTINKIENHFQIENFIKHNNNFKVIFEKQLLPNVDGTDGFYLCVLQKKE